MQDLRARISMINKVNGYQTPEPMDDAKKENEAEEALVIAAESSETQDEAPATVNEAPEKSEPSNSPDLAQVMEAIEDLKNEIVKMNKHINSIQKFIKKSS